MKKTVQRISKCKAFWGMLALVLVLGAGLFAGELAIVSHAESAAKVTASSAKIRKSADSSSEVIGSATKDKTISIKSQTKGADGYTWYEVYVDANTLGYIRSDLVALPTDLPRRLLQVQQRLQRLRPQQHRRLP